MNLIKKYIDVFLMVLLMLFIYPMVVIIMRYVPYNTDAGFLKIKQDYIGIDIWRNAFFIHVYSSIFVLFAGFTQFNKKLRIKRPFLHRLFGYAYVLNILLITGPASLIMGFYANGGITSRISFVLLSLLWITFTSKAVIEARKNNFISHQKFMIRSYALTLSAITLRAWKFGITNTLLLPPMDTYRLIAWLGWTVNLAIAEFYIRNYLNRKFNYQNLH